MQGKLEPSVGASNLAVALNHDKTSYGVLQPYGGFWHAGSAIATSRPLCYTEISKNGQIRQSFGKVFKLSGESVLPAPSSRPAFHLHPEERFLAINAPNVLIRGSGRFCRLFCGAGGQMEYGEGQCGCWPTSP